ncbi:hypothetical protein LTR36_002404 [Oleoguttula mirabilis]|uniref:Uncharacterized protein n=1 Tax=Oleoguttula mirabilis TaxID=1507867 RepID=A0AAV9JKP4_9PEZI|nr:hypothetical protein LTR36_002404 [Oleoguttula mirabilis]
MSTLAVVSQSGQTLNFFHLASGKRTGQLRDLTAEPHELCYDQRTGLLYISHAYEHGWYPAHGTFGTKISVVDSMQRKVVEMIDVSPAKGTHYLVLDSKRDILYASVEDGVGCGPNAGGIVGICLKTRKVIKAIRSGHKTHWFVMTPDGAKAYTCNKEAGFVSVIDLVNERMVGRIDMPGGCEQPGISGNGELAYFPSPTIGGSRSGAGFAIQVIDTTTDRMVQSISLDLGAVTVHVDSEDRLLVGQYRIGFSAGSTKPVPLYGGLLLLASAREGYRELGRLETGVVPLTIFASPDGQRAFVSNIFLGTVTVVDLSTMTVERTLQVDTESRADKGLHQGAHGLALIRE